MFSVNTVILYFAAFTSFTLALFKELSVLAPKHGMVSSFANAGPVNKGIFPPSNHDSSLRSYEIHSTFTGLGFEDPGSASC